MKNIIDSFKIEFDAETNQYTIINDLTPGIYWLWDTMEEAIEEYSSSFKDSFLISNKYEYEAKAIA